MSESGETLDRFRELRRTGSVRVRNALVEEYVGFAEYLARRYAHRGEPLDDVRQVALLGLVKAVDRFDPERGIGFTSFAAPTILGEIKRHFRDRTWLVRVPRVLQERSLEIEQCRLDLGHELGRVPTVGEIAHRAELTEEEVLEAMEARGTYRVASLDAASAGEGRAAPVERLAAPDQELLTAEQRLILGELLRSLPVRERRIVYLRFFEGLTQSEIAERIGISQMHVSRLLDRSLTRMAVAAEASEEGGRP
jgi:RNA polymerase sigma-B factor